MSDETSTPQTSNAPKNKMESPTPHIMHLGLAEAGKKHALKGNLDEALRHYREALRLAVSSKAPEVFFRHYTDCVMEALESRGQYDSVIQFLREAITHYETLDVDQDLLRQDRASLKARLGAVLLKAGQEEEAKPYLQSAIDEVGTKSAPMASELLNWLKRGFHLDATRITGSQKRHNVFTVRADRLKPEIARQLPPQESTGGNHHSGPGPGSGSGSLF